MPDNGAVLVFPNALGQRSDWLNLGRRIRMERTQAHLSVADLACASGVSASTIRRIEKGMPTGYFKLVDIGRGLGHTIGGSLLWDWGWVDILWPDHR